MDIQLETAPCGYFSITEAGFIQSVNRTFADMLGYSPDQLIGSHIETTLSLTNKLFFHTYFYPYIRLYGRVDEMYFSFRTHTDEDLPVLLNGVRNGRDGEQVLDCVVLAMRKRIEHEKDVLQTKSKLEELYQATREANGRLQELQKEYAVKQQELELLNAQLEKLATTDALTGMCNRRHFQANLEQVMEDYRRDGLPFSLLILDIDHFKKINDTFGHLAGDLVLRGLAELISSLSGHTSLAARYGGEEFVLLLLHTNQEESLLAAQEYCSAIEAAAFGAYRITVSIGIATVSAEDTEESLMEKADLALYASKAGGRNCVTHWVQMKRP